MVEWARWLATVSKFATVRGFSLCGGAVIAFGSGESSVDECSFSVVADVGKVWFELVANSGEI